MGYGNTIKINFRGGIISPGDLYNILVAATRVGITSVRFGLRQQLLLTVDHYNQDRLLSEFTKLGFDYEASSNNYPNIISSYPAEEIFITNSWLSEGVYKDIFDGIDYQPKLKINISDSNQSFTPILTGNINWVASSTSQHFWHLFIRFPKTNTIYEWKELVYTNDLPKLSRDIESLIFEFRELFYDNQSARGEQLFAMIKRGMYITRPADVPASLPAFNLPYYEGLNRYTNKYWLGIYRRDEHYSIDFLKALCILCLDTKIGQLCSTPWKSIIIKGIEEKDKPQWNQLLEHFQINMRHAANELNFQVEDDCPVGLELKNYLVKQLNDEDVRTFGLCIGIKTKKKMEIFSSILVRRKPMFSVFGLEIFHVYDILCAHDFNPNERTGFIFSKNNPRFLLGEQLRRSIIAFYLNRSRKQLVLEKRKAVVQKEETAATTQFVYQCPHCLSIYDELVGDPGNKVLPGTCFDKLPDSYTCSLCECSKNDFFKVETTSLGLQSV